MTRLKQAWLALFWWRKPQLVVAEMSDGVLFGLDPPDGHQFRVTSSGEYWHVIVCRNGDDIAHKCAKFGWDGRDDESVIIVAATRALEEFERKQRSADLEGFYPPKVAKGKRRNG